MLGGSSRLQRGETRHTRHHVGDSLPVGQVGQRLNRRARRQIFVARLGGDEFAIVRWGPRHVEAASLGRNVLNVLQTAFVLQDLPFNIEAASVVPLFTEDATGTSTRCAAGRSRDVPRERDGTGKSPTAPDHDRYSPRRLGLLGELRGRSKKTGIRQYRRLPICERAEVVGLRACTWNIPCMGFLPPFGVSSARRARPACMGPLTRPRARTGPRAESVVAWTATSISPARANVSARNLHFTELRDDITMLSPSGRFADCPSSSK